jgi:hypothetical protein
VSDDRDRVRYTVLIDRDDLDELDRIAEADGGASTASVVRRLLHAALERERAEMLERARRRTGIGR